MALSMYYVCVFAYPTYYIQMFCTTQAKHVYRIRVWIKKKYEKIGIHNLWYGVRCQNCFYVHIYRRLFFCFWCSTCFSCALFWITITISFLCWSPMLFFSFLLKYIRCSSSAFLLCRFISLRLFFFFASVLLSMQLVQSYSEGCKNI